MSDLAIRVQGLSKLFQLYDRPLDRIRETFSPSRRKYARDFWALKDVSFDVRRGTSLGFIGVNGAGKSTALKILSGKLRPNSGRVELNGQVSGILELGTGLQPALTGRQNARLNALFLGYDPLLIEEKLEEILEFSELGSYVDQPLETYSSGMKARLAFAVLTCLSPEILILDEALATGDVHFAEKCKRFLRELCSSGCTALIASHDTDFLAQTCDQLVWLDHGQVRLQGPPEVVVPEYLGLGSSANVSARPTHLLLRIGPAQNDAPLPVHSLELVAPDRSAVRGYYPGHAITFAELLDRTCDLGISRSGALAGWGNAGFAYNGSTYRELTPDGGPSQNTYFALPIPRIPAPVPAALKITCQHVLAEGMRVSGLIEGEWRELGCIGQSDGQRVGDDAWYSSELELTGFSGAEAPVAVEAQLG